MFTELHADVYESIYRSRGKDWGEEARLVADRIREVKPDTRSLLDVACGTGAHLGPFQDMFDHVEGIEIAEPMLELARKRLDPAIPLHHGDMRDFDLGRTFDTVVCMFCAIAYVDDLEQMRAAIRHMAAHLEPGGVLVVEPWWFPERFIEGYVAGDISREENRVITKVSHSVRQGHQTKMELRFVVAEATGITTFTEIELLCLWTKEEYLAAFADAGCPATFHEGPPTGRGLFIGVKAG